MSEGRKEKRDIKSMEKSFEDLLAGLEDDDEDLDLDQIISPESLPQKVSDASFNAMAYQKPQTYTGDNLDITKEDQGEREEEQEEVAEDFEIVSQEDVENEPISEPEPRQEEISDDEQSLEEEEGLVPEIVEPEQEEEEPGDRMLTDEQDDREVERKRPLSSDMEDAEEEPEPSQNHDGGLKRDASLDFSAVESTSHLDVNIGKQKTSLRKKGSLARRKKPTRTNVRTMLSSSEDSHFKDSTEPKPDPSLTNGHEEDVFEVEKSPSPDSAPTSPPAKKASPLMMPLPGMGKPLPTARKLPARPAERDAEMAPSEPKKDYKSMGVKLPMPALRPAKRERTSENDDSGHQFEKPSLKNISSSEREKVETEKESKFEVPALRNVERNRPSNDQESCEMDTDKVFTKPSLKKVDKPEPQEVSSSPVEKRFDVPALRRVQRDNVENSPSKNLDSEKLFDMPTLKNVNKDSNEARSKISPENEGRFGMPVLRNVPQDQIEMKRSESDEQMSDKVFEKPQLRNTPKPKMEPPTSPLDKGKFDLPALRRTPRVERTSSVEQKTGAFDKPALRNISKPVNTQLDFSEELPENSENKYKFDKPALRNVPRSNSKSEALSDIGDSGKKEEPNWFKDMKLRKTNSVVDENDSAAQGVEKASWIRAAAEKRSRAAELLNTKENQSKPDLSSKPEWTEAARLRKTPNGLPLQESVESADNKRNSRASSVDEDSKSTGRRSSTDAETPARSGVRDQYEPSWLKTRDTRHKSPSTPNLNLISPGTPAESSDIPQWKKELAERRKLKKDTDTPIKAKPQEEISSSGNPPWKRELALKKISTPGPKVTPSKSAEPEWKKQADERRQRIMSSGLLESQRRLLKNKDQPS